jgi:hypothetical protein
LEPISKTEKLLTNPVLVEVVKLLRKSHPLFKDAHSISEFTVRFPEDSKPRALILRSEASRTFTATGMFGLVWIFALDENADLAKICKSLRYVSSFSSSSFEVVSFDGKEKFVEYGDCEHAEPAFWSITDKDDFGPIMGSICRAVYAVVKKYGNSGLVDYLRVS